jgi:hypothetical protein
MAPQGGSSVKAERRHPLRCLSLLLILAACRSEAGRSGGAIVRDSAGVEIVENDEPAWPDGAAWRVRETPLLDIGVFEGDPRYQLFQVVGALRLDDGRIVVANAGTQELRFYDAGGTYLGSSGRKGSGPGEFKNMARLWALGPDSLMVWDWGNRRVSIFDARGAFARSFSLAAPGGRAFPDPIAPAADDALWVSASGVFISRGARTGVTRDSMIYLRYDLEGALLDTIGRFPGGEYYTKTFGQGFAVTSLPFGRQPQAAVYRAGLYFGASDSYEIGYYSRDGVLARLIRKAHTNLEVTAEDRERYIETRLEEAGSESWRERLRQMLSEMPFPETMPAYRRLLVDVEGDLWVADFRRPADEQPRWTVFDPAGRMLGTIEMPPRLRVFQIGSDFVLGRWRDELDVEHVRLYELIKP